MKRPLRWRRIYPGWYEAEASTRINDRPSKVRVVVRYIPEWPSGMRWAVEIWHITSFPEYPERQILAADDGPEATKSEAQAAAISALRAGWRDVPGLGLCLDS